MFPFDRLRDLHIHVLNNSLKNHRAGKQWCQYLMSDLSDSRAIWFFSPQLNVALALYAYAKFANSLGDCKMKGIYKKEVFLMQWNSSNEIAHRCR